MTAGHVLAAAEERERSLTALLRGRIAQRGPISFREFMETALYHPELGYYSNLRGFGAEGDFVTSPETHPVFGALVAREVSELWDVLGRPVPFRLLEYGGGTGTLARSILHSLRLGAPALAEAMLYTIDERSPSLQRIQQETLFEYGVRWGDPSAPQHCVLANEVLDALPVYRAVIRAGAPRELRVGFGEATPFAWFEHESAPDEVRTYLAGLGVALADGTVVEVNPGLAGWVAEVGRRLGRGSLALVIDYGYLADDLPNRTFGTLLTYYRHSLGSDPLIRVGRQDISVHVDFSTLATSAHRAGLQVLGLTTQRTLLNNLGLPQYAARLREPGNARAVAQLTDLNGLGRLKALFLGRGLPAEWVPSGLRGGRSWPEPGWVPTMPPDPDLDDFLDQWREAFGSDRIQ